MLGYYVLLFKQKAAYEMRISDWSSDVCSSDLRRVRARDGDGHRDADDPLAPEEGPDAPIHETEMARMPDRGGLGLGQKVEIAIGQRVRDRKSSVSGKSVSVRVDLGARPIIKKKTHQVY